MQERAMALMGKKLTAAQALEGRFSTEGLVAMGGEDANVEIALARSLVERMDEGDVRRTWNKVTTSDRGSPKPAIPEADPSPPTSLVPPRSRNSKRPALMAVGADRQPGWLF